MITNVIYAVLVLGVIAVVFGLILSVAAKAFEVKVDERLPKIQACLAGANCGGCGYPGCAGCAEAILAGKAPVTACAPAGAEGAAKIAEIMGMEAPSGEKQVAHVLCNGGEASVKNFEYVGLHDCVAATKVAGGPTACSFGCMGFGTCVAACQFDAIHINEQGVAEVDKEKCTNCGACRAACPHHLIVEVPYKQKVFVNCSNKDKGPAVTKVCANSCIGCGMCAAAVPEVFQVIGRVSTVLSQPAKERFFRVLDAANGCPVTVRTFDFGSDRTISDAYQGLQSSKLGLRGIRNSLRQPRQFETQLCALMRAAARGPLQVMFPMVTTVEDWDAAMRVVERCREHLRERGVPFKEDTKFGVMLSVPAACLTAEEFVAHGVDFLVVGTNDLTQYTHAADRELASAEHYYRPASSAMKKLITMVMDAARERDVPVTICGLAVGNPANTVQYLQLGLRSFSVSPQNLLNVKKALREAEIK